MSWLGLGCDCLNVRQPAREKTNSSAIKRGFSQNLSAGRGPANLPGEYSMLSGVRARARACCRCAAPAGWRGPGDTAR